MQTIKLGRILTDVAMGPFGSNLKAEIFQPTGVPVIRGQNLNEFYVSNEKLAYVSPEKAAGLSRSLASPGEIVVTHRGTLGQVSMIPFLPKYPTYLVSQSQMRLAVDRELADPRFVTYWMRSRVGQHLLLSFAVQTGVPAIARPTSSLRDYPIALPELGKQRAIADLLGSLDNKIATNNHILGIIDETIQSLWKHAVRARAAYTRLDDVIEINPRTPLPKGALARKVEMKNLPEAGFSISEWAEHEVKGGSRYRNGDTLLARITPCFENGKCGFVDFLETDAVGTGSTEFIVMRPHPDIPPAAPYAVARSADFRAFATQTMTGTSGRQRVQARDLEAYETIWPNGEQLSNFGSRTTPLLNFAGELRNESQVLAETRDELLPLLMSGKISVREAEQEATSAGADIACEESEA